MNRNLRKLWLIVPDQLPTVIRRCPKCKEKTEFQNSGKFRVNANGKLLDVWLIYRCSHCDTSWNMTIIERANPENIDEDEYKGFLSNSPQLAASYGSNRELFIKNKAEIVEVKSGYHILETLTITPGNKEYSLEIQIKNPSALKLRADVLLAGELEVSRSRIKKWFDDGLVTSGQEVLMPGARVMDGMLIQIKKEEAIGQELLDV
ncbi:DUF1062 domain-containing protein [Lacrimispora defluvii]|uniref:DUF1062 domain-containing protein n=1 Tax=Lacrimispora defluvii TaxID=2719233 RepID=A0ABX1VRA9_9FIRM|nr:DUF1062 domain-containing protein [Lacrimispora defluvii]NNJ28831.1 DUF1062 domain-containing protein [Lacrimispora defluvii]